MSEENKKNELSIPQINLAVFDTASSLTEEKKAKVREYSKLVKAREELIKKHKKLDEMISLIGEKWCKGYLWANKNGEVVPVFDIEDSYLKNIVNWCKKNDRDVPKEIKKEYYARFGYEDLDRSEDNQFAPANNKPNRQKFTYWDDESDDNNF